jgi:hypothetical protein
MSYQGEGIDRAADTQRRAEAHAPRDMSQVSAEDFTGLSPQDRNRLFVADPDRYRALRDGTILAQS